MKAVLAAALRAGARGAPAADRLCLACLPLLGVDAAAISLIDDGESRGTFGASDEIARALDGLQFTTGEGPCMEASHTSMPVLIADLNAPQETRWPAFRDAAARSDVRAVFAVPIQVGRITVGALDLFRRSTGTLSPTQLMDAVLVAEAAAQVLLDVVEGRTDTQLGAGPVEQWEQLIALAHIEVYQATGMLMAQLDVSAATALVRLRAYAFSHELTAHDVAQLIVTRQLDMQP
jgi:hypothetical protein